MHRFFADERGIVGGMAALEETDALHAQRVLRLSVNDTVTLIANGGLYLSRITAVSGEGVTVAVQSRLPSTEPLRQITLYQGLPKADKMDMIVQKCTELGVCRIVPVLMARCVARPEAKDAAKKRERWQKIAREAAKQSGRCIVPEIALPVALNALCPSHDLMLAPWEEAQGLSLQKAQKAYPDALSIGVLIGPEGGITKDEIASSPFRPVTLGPRILRTETAGICALSALYALYGDME